ncbi:hypothetical protein EV359DRAFT_76074 [Lentinula novae-zelandiae]|nr:hypothetical protein EV359DRAFT_76074 [Lentinula novae-zelandiae]
MANLSKINVLMCGTALVLPNPIRRRVLNSLSMDNELIRPVQIGVVGLTLFDLRRLGKVDKLGMAGVNGGKFPAIREHLDKNIGGVYKDMDLTYAVDNKEAIDNMSKGDAVIIFTPDPTHYAITMYAIERGIHVLVTKPAVQLLSHHNELIAAAKKYGVVCMVEHHKRFDPAYSDARAKAEGLGEFNFFSAWMSQPKSQLETFRAWAGKDSDIRQAKTKTHYYYLSSHHIDICCWMLQDKAIPTRVVASAATGIATSEPYNCVPQTEDTITLLVDWESTTSSKHKGTGVYTASWTAPLKAGVHSAQHWYYMGEKGDITVDQAHRGYDVTVDDTGKTWYNPFYMKYSPSESGHFDGQRGYGYVSIEKFIDAARSVNAGHTKAEDYDKHGLPTIANTVLTTAILHAGRISLDEKRPVGIKKNDEWVLE